MLLASGSNDTFLSLPPRMSTVGLFIVAMAFCVESTFVPFESLIHVTPSSSRTVSMRCSTPLKVLSTSRIVSQGTPITPAIVTAASAFSRLCGPGIYTSSQRQTRCSPSPSFKTMC